MKRKMWRGKKEGLKLNRDAEEFIILQEHPVVLRGLTLLSRGGIDAVLSGAVSRWSQHELISLQSGKLNMELNFDRNNLRLSKERKSFI